MYFFQDQISENHERKTCAMTCLLFAPDPGLLESSSGALRLCYYPERSNFAVFDTKTIQAVVAALPDPNFPGYFSIVEQLGTNLHQSTGVTVGAEINRAAPDEEDSDDSDPGEDSDANN